MRFCLILEQKYRFDGMPLDVARELELAGHEVTLLEPHQSLPAISEIVDIGQSFDAYILKTVSEGPGLSILDAASASGHMTINRSRSIRLARDKAVASALCRNHGIPSPLTYFAATGDLLTSVPPELYPIVVKPSMGSSGEYLRLVRSPSEMAELATSLPAKMYLAQPFVENAGFDLKLYCTGRDVFTTVQASPLHEEVAPAATLIDTPAELRRLVETIGKIFDLDVFGVDVVESPEGPMVVDINDFPSFRLVPNGPALVAEHIAWIGSRGRCGERSRGREIASLEPLAADLG